MTITDRPHARLRFAGRSLDLESLEIRETFRIERFDPARHGERLEALTRMLHRAYAPLAARGLRFVATHQDAEVTRQRLGQGEGFVGFLGDRLVATITLVHEDPSEPSAWYQRPDVSFLTQFAVDPDSQGHGLGNLLLDHVETLARARGSRHLALDTSEHAADLIDLYTRKGFATVETTRWEQTNYTSVVMSKPLGTP